MLDNRPEPSKGREERKLSTQPANDQDPISLESESFTSFRDQLRDKQSPLGRETGGFFEERTPRKLSTQRLHEDLTLYGKPYILIGRKDRPTIVFYGGLAATGFPWHEIAREVNAKYGARCEVYPLAGHNGSWRDLKQADHEDWIADITNRSKNATTQDAKPIFFGFSTSAAAAIEASARNPDLFQAMVLVAPPIHLRKKSLKIPLAIIERLDHYIPPLRPLFRKLTASMPPLDANEYTHELLNNPRFNKLPVTTFIALARLQHQVRGSLDKVQCPILFVQGGEDGFIHLDEAEKAFEQIGSNDKEFVAYKDSPHAVMLSKHKGDLYGQVVAWLDRLIHPPEDTDSSSRVRVRRSIRDRIRDFMKGTRNSDDQHS